MKKTARAVRRYLLRFFKGKSKARDWGRRLMRFRPGGIGAFIASFTEDDRDDILSGVRGKGEGRCTAGEGMSRRRSLLLGKSGNIRKCHNCDSEDRIIRDCPRPKGSAWVAP